MRALHARARVWTSRGDRVVSAEVWKRLWRDTRARIGLIVVALLLLVAILAPVLARHDPVRVDLLRQFMPPSTEHWMGTDVQGRDVWARLVYGARISLAVGLISQSIALALGLTLGLIAGYYGRWIDDLVMRLADITLAFPTLLTMGLAGIWHGAGWQFLTRLQGIIEIIQ